MSVLESLGAGTRLALWGYGREGRATRRFLETHVAGLVPTVVTDLAEPAVEGLPSLAGEDGRNALSQGRFDVVVKSPGISLYRPEVEAARRAGSIVTSSTNLWFEQRPERRVLAITGTKGKSTTASLIAHLWRGSDPDVALAGNVGAPLVTLPPVGAPVVLELSSYQIADLDHGPDLMLLTNLFPEHRDWHRSHEAYFRDKTRLVELAPVALLNAGDPGTLARLAGVPHAHWYGRDDGWHAAADGVRRGADHVVDRRNWSLRGDHNLANLAAALAALDVAGADVAALALRAASFRGLPHRLEVLGERDGLLWVNDSISTTPESAVAALDAFADRTVTLLLGGQERGQDTSVLAATLARRPATIIAMPDNGARLASDLAGCLPDLTVHVVADLEAAVERAREVTAAGGVVLLSPAAPSYGRFRDFEDRGEAFTLAVGFATGAALGG